MLHRKSFRAMGSDMLAILEIDGESAPQILDSVPAWFEEWEQTLSRFRADSELSRLNQAFDQPIRVSETLWDVFHYALSANLLTNGLVTPTVLDAVLNAGYDRTFDDIPANQKEPETLTWRQVRPLSLVIWDEREKTICLPKGVQLDFGGIAKGWAAQQAVERLKEYGPALMNAGGDIAISGPRDTEGFWLVGVSDPFETGTNLEILKLTRCGVASSGQDRRRWLRGGVMHHHIINPKTARPAVSDILRVTVVAPTVMEAEAAAKAVFILGSYHGLAWLEENSLLAGILILHDGQMMFSKRIYDYL